MQVISRGMQHRRMGSHELNMESSRSHSIMTVYCDTAVGPPAERGSLGSSLTAVGKISFVDLVSGLPERFLKHTQLDCLCLGFKANRNN